MAMDLKAFDTGTGYQFRVHLDMTKVLANGTPDPDWVCEWTWCKQPPPGQTADAYLANCKREAQALADLELARKQPPTEISLPM